MAAGVFMCLRYYVYSRIVKEYIAARKSSRFFLGMGTGLPSLRFTCYVESATVDSLRGRASGAILEVHEASTHRSPFDAHHRSSRLDGRICVGFALDAYGLPDRGQIAL